MRDIVRFALIVEQHLVGIGKDGAVRVPALIGARARQYDFIALGDLTPAIFAPRAPVVHDVEKAAPEQGADVSVCNVLSDIIRIDVVQTGFISQQNAIRMHTGY
jgi:hypothetical protein